MNCLNSAPPPKKQQKNLSQQKQSPKFKSYKTFSKEVNTSFISIISVFPHLIPQVLKSEPGRFSPRSHDEKSCNFKTSDFLVGRSKSVWPLPLRDLLILKRNLHSTSKNGTLFAKNLDHTDHIWHQSLAQPAPPLTWREEPWENHAELSRASKSWWRENIFSVQT